MKMIKLFLFLTLIWGACSCNQNQEPEPSQKPTNEIPFTLKVYDISAVMVTVEVEPLDKEARYYTDVLNKADFELAQENGFNDYLAWLTANLMEQTGSSLSDTVDLISSYGNDGFILTSLIPESEYYAFAVGIDENGKTTTEVIYEAFSTTAKGVSENQFDVELCNLSVDNVTLEITPTNNDPYIVAIEPLTVSETMSDQALAEFVIQSNMAWGGLEAMTYTGEAAVDHLGKAAWQYEAIIFGYEKGSITTDITRIPFTLLEGGDPAACSFTLNHSFDNFKIHLETIPSDNTVVYVSNILSEGDFQSLIAATGSEEAAMREHLNQMIEEITVDLGNEARTIDLISLMGPIDFELNFQPATQYRHWAVAINQAGEPTAPFVLSEPITTPDEVASDVTLTLKEYCWYNGSELAALYPEQFGSAKGYAVVDMTVEPSADAAHWWSYVALEDLTDRSRRVIINNLITSPTEMDATRQLVLAFWGTNTIMGVAQDASGNYGELMMQVVEISKETAQPAENLRF